MISPTRSILAIDISPFGRSLELVPAMRALRAAYQKTLLVAAASTGTCELLRLQGLADETIDLGVIKASHRGARGAFKRLIGLARGSRRYGFDLVLDFAPALETQVVSHLVLRARRLSPLKLPLVIQMMLGSSPGRKADETSDYRKVLQQAGVKLNDPRFGIILPAEDDARFEELLRRSGSKGGEPIAVLFATDTNDSCGWPVEAFGEIGTRLTNNFSVRLVAADEPADRTFTDAVSSRLPAGAIKLAEPTAVELVAGLARASVVITDERSIAELASELGTPAIEVADSARPAEAASGTHRVMRGSSRSKVSTDEVFDVACEIIQESRSISLFRRP